MTDLAHKTLAYTNWIDFSYDIHQGKKSTVDLIEQVPIQQQGLMRLITAAAAYNTQLTVVVDVDDTLLDTTPRSQAIANYLLTHTNARLPLAGETISALERYVGGSIPHYFFGKALRQLGASEIDIARCEAAWMDQFFTSLWLDRETPLPGAAEYLQALAAFQVNLIYLTGRDTPFMRAATESHLRRLGLLDFQLDQGTHSAVLITKDDYREDDVEFKRSAMASIRTQRPLALGLIENEPKNLAAMLRETQAWGLHHRHAILVDTVRASDPDKELVAAGLDFSFPKDFRFPS